MNFDTQIVYKINTSDEIYIAYAASTNMPFITCNGNTFDDQVWIFSSVEGVQKFADKYKPKKIIFKAVRVLKENLREFYAELDMLGINEIIFCHQENIFKLPLHKLAKTPDYTTFPEKQRPLVNPSLALSALYFLQESRRQNDTPDREKLHALAEELYANLAKSKFMVPIKITQTADQKNAVQLPLIKDNQGNYLQLIFSDHMQYIRHIRRQPPAPDTRVLIVPFSDLEKHLSPNAHGFLLNPDSYQYILTKEHMKSISENFSE